MMELIFFGCLVLQFQLPPYCLLSCPCPYSAFYTGRIWYIGRTMNQELQSRLLNFLGKSPQGLCSIYSAGYIPVILLLTTTFITLEFLSRIFNNMLHMFLLHYSLPMSSRFGSHPFLLPSTYLPNMALPMSSSFLATDWLFKRYLFICINHIVSYEFQECELKNLVLLF